LKLRRGPRTLKEKITLPGAEVIYSEGKKTLLNPPGREIQTQPIEISFQTPGGKEEKKK